MLKGVSLISKLVLKIIEIMERLLRNRSNNDLQEKIDEAYDDPFSSFSKHFSDGMCENDDAYSSGEADDTDE